MNHDEIIDRLVDRWETLRDVAAGEGRCEPKAEEICAEYPELIEQFKEVVRNLKVFDNVFGATEVFSNDAERPADVGEFCHGRFKVEAFHDQGGLGTLFLARDTELDRLVIVKGIRADRSDHAESRRQFVNEAAVTGQLEHPGVVPVYGFGRDERRRPYYAMRMIRGTTLGEAIRRLEREPAESAGRNVKFRRLLGDFLSVCRTIQFAHSRGVIHRDIKPANIMLGRYGEVLVVDWGLAKVVADAAGAGRPEAGRGSDGPPAERPTEDRPQVDRRNGPVAEISTADAGLSTDTGPVSMPEDSATRQGTIKGSPAYMSPEQAAGRSNEVGRASDIYSLGATLYEILTGRAAFAGGPASETIERVKRGEFVAPRSAAGGVAPALEAICLKAMRLDPGDRYESAQALADDVERWLADEPVSVYAEPIADRLRRWGRRHRAQVTGAAAAVLVALVASAAASAVLKTKNDQLVSANERTQAAEQKAVRRADELERALYANRMARAASALEATDVRKVFGELAATNPELRSLEWNYARRLAAWPPILPYHTARPLEMSEITRLEASPDGKWLVTDEMAPRPGEDPNTTFPGTHLLAAADGTPKLGMGVGFLAFSRDASHVLRRRQAGDGKAKPSELELVDPASGRTIWTTAAPEGNLMAAAFYRRDPADPPPAAIENATAAKAGAPAAEPLVLAIARMKQVGGESVRTVVFEYRDGRDGRVLETVDAGKIDDLSGARLSPDGRRFVAGTPDAEVWSSQTGKKLYPLAGPPGLVYSLAFRADGKQIAAAGERHSVHTYDASDGRKLATFWGHASEITALAFSTSGDRLASVGKDGGIRLWNAADGEPQTIYLTHDKLTRALAFSRDDGLLYVGGSDGVVRTYEPANVPAGRVLREEYRVSRVRLSPSGEKLATIGGHDGTTQSAVRIYDRASGTTISQVDLPAKSTLEEIAYGPDDRSLLIVGDDYAAAGREFVRMVEAGTGKLRWEVRNVGRPAAFVAGGKLVAAARPQRPLADVLYGDTPDGKNLWDQVQGDEPRAFFELRKFIFEGRPSHRLGSEAEFHGMGDRTIVDILKKDARNDELLAKLRERAAEGVLLLDMETGAERGTLQAEASRMAGDASGGRLAVAGPKEISLWDVAARKRIAVYALPERVRSLALSPDGERLAITGILATAVLVLDAKTGELRHKLDEHLYPVQEIAYTPDGRRIVTAAVDGTIRFWDPETGVPLWTTAASRHGLYTLDVSRDGRFLATAGGDEPRPGEMIVWDVSPVEK